MIPNATLIAKLEQQLEQWEALAKEARSRADQYRPGDLSPTYLYGCSDQLDRNAQAVRDVVDQM